MEKESFATAAEDFRRNGYTLLTPIHEGGHTHSLYKEGRFVASLSVGEDGRILFDGSEYASAEEAIPHIEDYVASLEYPPETYDPDISDEHKETLCIDHIYKKMGFKFDGLGFDGENFVSDGLVGMHYGRIINSRSLVLGTNRWIDLFGEESDTDGKCRTAKYILYALYSANVANICSILKESGDLGKLLKLESKEMDEDTLETKTKDMKAEILAVLKKAVAMLEDENPEK